HLSPPHLLHHLAHLAVDVLHQLARLERGAAALLGQPAHFVGHDGEAFAVLPGTCRLDGGVEREQVRHIGQLADRGDEPGDPAAHLSQLLYLARASPTNALRATSRPIASLICPRFLFATSLAVVEARAASVPSADTRRDTWARLSVASSPPETSPSSARTPWRIRPVDWATAPAASRIESAARASVASCWVRVSTVSTSGR